MKALVQKKRFKVSILLILALVLVLVLGITMTAGNRVTTVIKTDNADIEYILVRNMNNGEECKITGKEQINSIVDYLETIKCQRRFFSAPSTGGQYSIHLYGKNSNDKIFFAGKNSTVNDKKYNLNYNSDELDHLMVLAFSQSSEAKLDESNANSSGDIKTNKEAPWTAVDYNYYVSEGYISQLEEGHYTGAFYPQDVVLTYLNREGISTKGQKKVVLESTLEIIYRIELDNQTLEIHLEGRKLPNEPESCKPYWYVTGYRTINP
jgi:hypothetical protein